MLSPHKTIPISNELEVKLGLCENWEQFSLLVVVNAFVGSMVGMERVVLPLLAEQEFGLVSRAAILSFIVSFGLIRSSALNALSGDWSADTLSALTRAARDEYRVVRIQAGAVLAAMDSRKLDEPSRRAAEEYIASLKSRPDDYGQHMNLAVLYADRGQSQAALDEYATAVRLRPGWAPPLVNASLVYSALGNNAKAEESLRKAIGIDPGNAAAHFNLGLLLAETGRRADAEASLRRSLALDPKNAPAAFNLAVLLSGTRRAEAIRWCRRAVEADPGQGRYVYTLAFYLAQGGETQAAIRELEAAAAHHSPTPEEQDLLNSLRSR